ncbi:winged helix-turn-helix domain-containing protein [Amycolatopsis minnesotensis]|uniref:ArsR/SmtB family transcription factor n=1 Tax=Amycolatopsis minnesotensis TaxID=337894 RepID=UPI0031D860F6
MRLVSTVGMESETVFALDMLGRAGRTPFAEWHKKVHAELGSRAQTLKTLVKALRPTSALLSFRERPTQMHEEPLEAAGIGLAEAQAAIEEFREVAVRPTWMSIRRHLEGERSARGRILATGGVDRLLATLHSRVRWDSKSLQLQGCDGEDVRLDGRGLALAPSFFLHDRDPVLVWECGQPTLVFPALPDPAGTGGEQVKRGERALIALVGRTRAEVMRALTAKSTTGQLAGRLGVSPAGASQHTGVLRQAGLITTERSRNTVLHALTPLGHALLGEV